MHAYGAGAYYGLAASLQLSRKQPMHGLEHPKNGASYLNDVFSMIGTLFLWLYVSRPCSCCLLVRSCTLNQIRSCT